MIPIRAITAAVMRSRSAWEAAGGAEPALELTDFFRAVWEAVSAYYARDAAATSANLEILNANLARRYTNPKHTKAVLELVAGLAAEPVSVDNVRDYLQAELVDRTGTALAAGLAARRPREETDSLLEAYRAALGGGDTTGEQEPDCTWAEAIRSRIDRRDRIQVTPRSLNERLGGGLLPGNNVTIFGRPESGKSALAITLACGFARRGHRVLYIGNEDPIQSLMVRAISNFTGRILSQIESDPDGALQDAVNRGSANLFFKQLAPGTLRELDAEVRRCRPGILIVDQLRNLSSKSAENFTQNLDAIARGVRSIGIRHTIATISVTQAGDSATGKSVLEMGDIDSSNTGIPGAADVLIGVGTTPSLEAAGMRKLSLPKNKLTGIHEAFEVRFNSQLSKVES
jgi:archaellum biogenesis ATPase FlaH